MRSRLALGYLLPRLLVATLMIDVGLRFLPTGLFSASPWLRYRLPGEAYERNVRAVIPRIYGDLATLGNLTQFRLHRSESLTTDRWGFRNLPHAGPFCAILVGDSFALSGVNDHETLSAQLARVADCGIYNVAGVQDTALRAPSPQRLVAIARRLNLGSGLVISEFVERLPTPTKPRTLSPSDQDGDSRAMVRGVVAVGFGWATFSPSRILARRLCALFEDDRVLPNRHAKRILNATLKNGNWMLFYDEEMEAYRPRRPVSAEYWIWLQDQLAKADLRLLVVLVPNKYTVYHDLLRDEPPLPVESGESLARLERQLRGANVPVVNLTAPLREQAALALAKGILLYYQDDTHWNALGVELAAIEIHRAWRRETSAR